MRWCAITVVVAIAVVGAACSRSSRGQPAATRGPLNWVSLGDSYASADGLPGSGPPCDRSDQAFAPVAEKVLSPDYPIGTFTHAACSGAKLDDIAGQLAGARSALPKGRRYDLATLEVGGNDIGFVHVLLDCVGVTDFKPGCDVTPAELRARVDALEPRLERLYRTIADALAPDGELVVLGYPQLLEPPDRWTNGLGLHCESLRPADAVTIRDAASALDDAIARAATAVGNVHFVDVRATFAGHQLCGPDPWIHGVGLHFGGRSPAAGSFHPTATGQTSEAQLVVSYLRGRSSVVGRESRG